MVGQLIAPDLFKILQTFFFYDFMSNYNYISNGNLIALETDELQEINGGVVPVVVLAVAAASFCGGIIAGTVIANYVEGFIDGFFS